MYKTVTGCAFVLALAATPALAAKIKVDEGCTAVATLHREYCAVTTLMDCGDFKIDDTYLKGKRIDRHILDDDWGLIGYVADQGSMSTTFDTVTEGGISVRQMVTEGRSSSTQSGTFMTGIIKGREVGMDQTYEFDGETVEISGIPFYKGTVKRLFRVHPKNRDLDAYWNFDIYLAEDFTMFFEGDGESIMNGMTRKIPFAPLSISLPGQVGFAVDRSDAPECR